MTVESFLIGRPTTNLEYWFFKVNAGPVSLLVDWITRRIKGENLLRTSIHSPVRREVLFEQVQGDLMNQENFLRVNHTRGRTGNVSWDLGISLRREIVVPDIFPAGLLRMSDLQLVSAPLAEFSGWIKHAGQTFTVQNSRGMISHYWGRQLAAEWWWISSNQFDVDDTAVECSFFKSGIWGSKFTIPLAYLYLWHNGKGKLIMGTPGSVSVRGTHESFELVMKRLGAPSITLKGTGREYGDFGEGIANTLVGDLEVYVGNELIGRSVGRAGLERRASNVTSNSNNFT